MEEESTNPIQRIFGSITDRERERESERGMQGNGGGGWHVLRDKHLRLMLRKQ